MSANNTIYAKTIDKVGNVSTEKTLTINNIVKTAPVVTFTPNGSSTPAKSQETTVKVTATSPATVSSREYAWSTSKVTPASGWQTFTDGSTITKSDGAGVYYLHIKATDNAGNTVSTVSEPFIFNTAPKLSDLAISPSIVSDKTGYNTITITGKATDVDNDALDIYYKIGASGMETKAKTNITNGDFSFTIVMDTTLKDGVYEIYVWADDNK